MAEYQALSTVYGAIETVLLSYPKLAGNVSEVYARYKSLIEKFPEAVKFAILVQFDGTRTEESIPAFAHEIRERLQTKTSTSSVIIPDSRLDGILIEPLVDYRELHRRTGSKRPFRLNHYFPSEWSQDPFVVIRMASEIYALLKPIQFQRTNISKPGDQLLADYVAAQLSYTVKPFPFQIEGGNIHVGDTYALIGTDTLRTNISLFRKKLNVDQITEYFSYGLGVQNILWLGGIGGQIIEDNYTGEYSDLRQLVPHIDTFVVLGGKCPDNRKKELVFVADVREEYCIDVSASVRQKYSAYFDRVADSLEKCTSVSFKPVKVPTILYGAGDLVFLPFTNALTEYYQRRPGDPPVKNIYMPSYADSNCLHTELFNEAQREATAIYNEYGFTVHDIQSNFFARARSNGSLRCIAKVLRRADFQLLGREHDIAKRKGIWLTQ